MDLRFYPNPYENKKLNFNFQHIEDDITEYIQKSHSILRDSIHNIEHGFSLYSGGIGIALTTNRIYEHITQSKDRSTLPRFPLYLDSTEGSRRIGLNSNNLAIQMYNCYLNDRAFDISPTLYRSPEANTEIITGKAGLILMLNYFISKGMRISRSDLIDDIISTINLSEFPWKFNHKQYFGAAHGTSGILLVLKRFGDIERPDFMNYLLKHSLLSSNNFKSSSTSTSDDLVQWCHGSPGFISLLYEYQYSLKKNYSLLITNCLNDIWKRGLLKKGNNICHGIAGNGYCFLTAYIQTGDIEYFQQAIAFAQEIMKIEPQLSAQSDNMTTTSLFEGLAGTVHYLLDTILIINIINKSKTNDEILSFPLEIKLFDGLLLF